MIQILLLFYTLAQIAAANVEKIIFNAPPPFGPSPPGSLALSTLALLNKIPTLTHDARSLRTELNRDVVSERYSGHSSWILVRNLTENQRYELRVCWSALEPTDFKITAHYLDTVLGGDSFAWPLDEFLEYRPKKAPVAEVEKISKFHGLLDTSALLIEIQAAADYYTDDGELMAYPPPVLVDLILDPFLLNVLPRSLLPTVGYLLLVGVTTWYMAQWIKSGLLFVAGISESKTKKQE
ncbi:uncharacterized protein CPUR_03934 [Claviceps purpurea 20.1]|uniref:Uncharacterized protein n=1 Tax=Claviceps purpurea (strain 20.1) TaxID=1111077 RepID=M1W0V0_CLAP2|nr:uncharacterized protein CPUR_03934 [Claviceps purpurea 20.1]